MKEGQDTLRLEALASAADTAATNVAIAADRLIATSRDLTAGTIDQEAFFALWSMVDRWRAATSDVLSELERQKK